MPTSTPSSTAVAILALALFGTVSATPIVDYDTQQLHDLWAAAVVPAVTPAAAPPVITGRPFRPPFLPPWLTGGIGNGGTLPAGWGTGPLTAGAVCGPYTLPVNLPFSPPCPFSTTARATNEPEPTEKETNPVLPGTTIHPTTHSAPTATPPGPPESSTASHPPPPPPVSSTPLMTPTPRPSDITTTSVIKTLPPTTLPAGTPAVGSPTQVIVTVSVTLRPDPPYIPGPAGEGPKTTLSTVRRE
ncbi:hypothetical protein Sste5346_002065 [Sporothrix stenoceras]|uniref:Uncharacterized protein n=1 Tax=Sporothrix stenoceras TaxID=5173 RepID=A0ABR3ZLP1_9PEZI